MKKIMILMLSLVMFNLHGQEDKKANTEEVKTMQSVTFAENKEGISSQKDTQEVSDDSTTDVDSEKTPKENKEESKIPKEKLTIVDNSNEDFADSEKDSEKVLTKKKKRVKRIRVVKRRKGKEKSFMESLPAWLKDDGSYHDKVMLWGGMGKHLYGYMDERYDGYDQGDYLKTATYNFGIEYYKVGLFDGIDALKDLKAGFNIAFRKRNDFEKKVLEEMKWGDPERTIPEKTVPGNERDMNAESWINLGFFAGLNNKWYAIDLGLTVSLNPYYEASREFKNGDKKEGRGWLWGSGTTIYPNFHLRLGKEDSAHFVFNVLREDYDLKYGVINMYVSIPISSYFALDVGGDMYQIDSLFIAPRIKFKNFSAKFKMGTIINYQDDYFEKIAIFDSLFGNLSLAYEW